MLTVVLLMLASPLMVIGNNMESNLLDCTPGDEWTRDHVHFRCTSESSRRSYDAIHCVGDDGETVKPGNLHKESNFEYECVRDDVDTLEYRATRCFTPKGTPIAVGGSVIENAGSEDVPDNLMYSCEEHFSNGGSGERTVVRSSTRQIKCNHGSKKVDVGEKVIKDGGVFVCKVMNGKPHLIITGCVLSDGNEIGKGAVVGEYYCQCDVAANTGKAVKQALTCKDQEGNELAFGSSWVYEMVEYKCLLSTSKGVAHARVKPQQCVFEVNYESGHVSKTQRKRVKRNQVHRMDDGHTYWCKPVGVSKFTKRPNYVMTRIASSQSKCANGRRLNKHWVKDNVHSKCYFINGAPQVRDKQCVTDDRKPVKRMSVSEIDGRGYVCEPNGPWKLRFRVMSEEEYRLWKIAEGSVSGVKGWGRGVKQYDSDGNAICDDGYEAAGHNECQDINECQEGSHSCGSLESCRNTEGSFECVCQAGYARTDEQQCEKVFCPCMHGQDCFDCY